MHPSSLHNMRLFIESLPEKGKALDVGSRDINGTYRDLFKGWDYTGIDVVPGKNVDMVVGDEWSFDDESFDAVVSGQALEHIKDDAGVVLEMARVLKSGGHICLIAPSTGAEHMEPDYRRYTEQSLGQLIEDAGLILIETRIDADSPIWHDVIAIGVKA